MKFKVGQEGVKTRGGHDVRIISVDGSKEYPIVGIVGNDKSPSCWPISGCHDGEANPSRDDLILPKRKVVRTIYVNVYDGGILTYISERDAKAFANLDKVLKIAHPVVIEVEVDG